MKKSEKTAEYIFAENSVTAQFLAVLGIGEENAITSRQIQKAFGISQRDLRKITERCRRAGIFIVANNAGYFFPANREELRRFVRRENRRIKSQCVTLSPMKRALKELDSG